MSTTTKKKEEEKLSTGYVESDAVRQAKENLSSLQKPGAYQSQWQQSLNDVIGKIQNREKFTYDLNGDALYQQYKDQYVTQGQQAMMDTMGQAAALTGGYGNSYAQSVGQQTYQGYLQQLNDRVPELYQLALDQYNRETDDLYNQYGLYADRDETEYGRYRDSVADFNTERDYLAGRYDSERDFDYGKYADERDFGYQVERDEVADSQWQTEFDEGVRQFDTQLDYQKDRDAVADSQWQAEFDESKRQFDTTTALTREEMQIQQSQWQAEFNESVRQYNKDYELTVKQIEEDIRHNKITEAQGQQQINLAKAELEQRKVEDANDYAYKMASLETKSSSGGSSGGSSGDSSGGSSSGSGSSGGNAVNYSDWNAGDWEAYFASIRQSEGKAAAEKELEYFTSNGLIPKKFVAVAASGARGSSGGH